MTLLRIALVIICFFDFYPYNAYCQELERGSTFLPSAISIPRLTHSFREDPYLYYMEQRLREDLASLIQLGQEITKEAPSTHGNGNYKQVSHRANRIRKLTTRIKSTLTLGGASGSEKNSTEVALQPSSASPEILQKEIQEIGRLVYRIQKCYIRRGKHVIDAKLQVELYQEVDALETLARHVKQRADQLTQAN
jgi:hypothetical protein